MKILDDHPTLNTFLITLLELVQILLK